MATRLYMFGIDITTNYKVVAKSRKEIIKLVRSYGMFRRTVGGGNCNGSMIQCY